MFDCISFLSLIAYVHFAKNICIFYCMNVGFHQRQYALYCDINSKNSVFPIHFLLNRNMKHFHMYRNLNDCG